MKIRIAENIRSFRKAAGLTQEQLAEAVGVTVGAVSKWEASLSNPDLAMIVKLADLFEISVDVLLGYDWKSMSMGQAAARIKELCPAKKYGEGRETAEKALLKYPNCFEVVYQSALLFHIAGADQSDGALLRRALALYRRALSLIVQNTIPGISEFSLQDRIGEVYMELEDTGRAVEHLKKYDLDGSNAGKIGAMYVQAKQYDKALPYLSDSLLSSVSELVNTAVALACYYGSKKDCRTALELLDWARSIVGGLKAPGSVSYWDKIEVILLTNSAQVCADTGGLKEAEARLRQAKAAAERFDKAPDHSIRRTKFYRGPEKYSYDGFGESAMQGIEACIREDKAPGKALLEIWKKITDEKVE